mgnify:CR=1 FL=1|tara:strand:- start:276 stop:428 length:153 start_codon:yes stop_codon:yes gene_type:complete
MNNILVLDRIGLQLVNQVKQYITIISNRSKRKTGKSHNNSSISGAKTPDK